MHMNVIMCAVLRVASHNSARQHTCAANHTAMHSDTVHLRCCRPRCKVCALLHVASRHLAVQHNCATNRTAMQGNVLNMLCSKQHTYAASHTARRGSTPRLRCKPHCNARQRAYAASHTAMQCSTPHLCCKPRCNARQRTYASASAASHTAMQGNACVHRRAGASQRAHCA